MRSAERLPVRIESSYSQCYKLIMCVCVRGRVYIQVGVFADLCRGVREQIAFALIYSMESQLLGCSE